MALKICTPILHAHGLELRLRDPRVGVERLGVVPSAVLFARRVTVHLRTATRCVRERAIFSYPFIEQRGPFLVGAHGVVRAHHAFFRADRAAQPGPILRRGAEVGARAHVGLTGGSSPAPGPALGAVLHQILLDWRTGGHKVILL